MNSMSLAASAAARIAFARGVRVLPLLSGRMGRMTSSKRLTSYMALAKATPFSSAMMSQTLAAWCWCWLGLAYVLCFYNRRYIARCFAGTSRRSTWPVPMVEPVASLWYGFPVRVVPCPCGT